MGRERWATVALLVLGAALGVGIAGWPDRSEDPPLRVVSTDDPTSTTSTTVSDAVLFETTSTEPPATSTSAPTRTSRPATTTTAKRSTTTAARPPTTAAPTATAPPPSTAPSPPES